ncbi:MAG TPA: hypothetical protein VN700_07595 [Vicinamibacterales bacterium]|nr:hypothetical protein [Vicinamibacterales bacterium]
MRKHLTWLLAAGFILTGSAAYAQATPPQKPAKAAPAQRLHVKQRIRQGVQRHQLTKPEVQQLRQRFAEIRKQGKALRADGKFSPRDRMKMHHEWRKASRGLFLKRHNRIKR